MAGALIVAIPGFWWVKKMPAPLADDAFHIPEKPSADTRLVVGSAIFGMGWAIVGLCPGPAFAGLALLQPESFMYVAAMLIGMLIAAKTSHLFFK